MNVKMGSFHIGALRVSPTAHFLKDVDYLVDLVQAVGVTGLTFDEEDVSIAIGFGNSVGQTAELLKTLGNSSEQWEYIEVLQRLSPLRQPDGIRFETATDCSIGEPAKVFETTRFGF